MHTYLQHTAYPYNLHYTHGPGSWTLQEKETVKWTRRTGRHCRPMLQLPTGQFSQLANMLICTTCDDPGAHGNEQVAKHNGAKWTGASKMNGARTDGQWAWQAKIAAGTQPAEQNHCRRTQPADSPSGTGLETNSQQLAGLVAETTAADDVGLPLAVQCR